MTEPHLNPNVGTCWDLLGPSSTKQQFSYFCNPQTFKKKSGITNIHFEFMDFSVLLYLGLRLGRRLAEGAAMSRASMLCDCGWWLLPKQLLITSKRHPIIPQQTVIWHVCLSETGKMNTEPLSAGEAHLRPVAFSKVLTSRSQITVTLAWLHSAHHAEKIQIKNKKYR